MASRRALTLAFLDAQPRAAADVLQELPARTAAAFLAEIPPALAARAVGEMTSWSAARCLDQMAEERVALVLAPMRAPQATHLLRLLDPQRVNRVLEGLPGGLARAYQQSLAFPPGSVGAWTDHSMPLFREHDLVQQALEWLREPGRAASSHVFVVDEHHRLLGAATLPALLGVTRRAQLGDLARKPVPSVAVQLPLAAAAKLPGWDEYLVLPVVGLDDAVLGGLARGALRLGLETAEVPAPRIDRSITTELVGALLATTHGMITTLLPDKETRR